MTRRWSLLSLLVAFAVVAVGCHGERGSPRHDESAPSAAPLASAVPARTAVDDKPGDAVHGKQLVAKFECNRCHEGTGMPEPPTAKACVGCHQQILAGTFKAPKVALERWKPNVVHVQFAPSLASASKRLKRAWITSFLLDPQDLRPGLVPSMPRLAITRDEARDIATYLAEGGSRAAQANLEGANLAHGRELIEQKACGTCHVFSGVAALTLSPAKDGGLSNQGIALAPDLRFARDRTDAASLIEWLVDPAAVKPGTPMPSFKLTRDEARDIAAYVLTTPLAPIAVHPVPKRMPPLDRPVAFKEVQERVLAKVCQHCHGNPDVALGDGGPGNTGGFGFPARALELASYRAVSGGLLDNNGDRHSVFDKTADGTPLLVAALYARQAEEAGHPVDGVRGMPLGLPSLAPEDIQIVDSWIAQGRPR